MATTIAQNYTNTSLTAEQLVQMMKSRGLAFADEQKALEALRDISYFRLAAYLRPMEADKQTHQYKSTATFEKALDLYRFDNELRRLLFAAIQTIEVSLRTRMIQTFSSESDPFWFFDESHCANKHNFLDNMVRIERELHRSREDFVKEHHRKYGENCFPPAWKTLEVVSFGTLSRLFCNYAKTSVKKRLARSYSVPQHEILETWIKAVGALRNACAHHARVWNCIMAQTPQLPNRLRSTWITNTGVDTYRLYALLCCIAYWLNAIDAHNTFVQDLKSLLAKYPNVDTAAMGFPKDWQEEALWK